MFTPGFDHASMKQYKQHHQEVMAEMQHYRLVKEALAARKPGTPYMANFLALIGKGLIALGTRLEKRPAMQPCSEVGAGTQGFNILL